MQKPPNILILMTDQQRADAAGFMANPILRTPHLDALAKEAVIFDNAYTPSPVCVPARPCIAAGKLPQTVNCLHYGDDIPPGSMTFARAFSQQAYHTVVCGKLHHEGPDQNQGWNLRVGLDNAIGASYIPDLAPDKAIAYPPKTQWWPWKKEVENAGVGVSPYMKRDLMAVDGALHILDEQFNSNYFNPNDNKPLLLKVSLTLPHYPFLTDRKRFDYYHNKVEPYLDETPSPHPRMSADALPVGEALTAEQVRAATAAYYGMTETADELFGQVIEKMRALGQDPDEWIIVFCSDHGEMLGEHAVWMKYKFYESSVRVPFFIRWPKKFPAKRIDANVNLCDLFATLCSLAEIPIPGGLDSRDLQPLMRGSENNWEDETLSQLDDGLMIKHGHLKYIYFQNDGSELLFDLKRDPHEQESFHTDPSHQTALEQFRTRRDAYLK